MLECTFSWAGVATGLQIADKQSRRSRICFTGALGQLYTGALTYSG